MSDEVVQEGLQYILETCFSDAQSPPANFYLGLCTDAVIEETDNLAALTEVAGTGYARQTIASDSIDFTSATTGTNDRKVTTTEETFTAGDTWTGAIHAFLATSIDGSGKLILATALSATRTLENGDTLKVSIVITLAG